MLIGAGWAGDAGDDPLLSQYFIDGRVCRVRLFCQMPAVIWDILRLSTGLPTRTGQG